MSLKKGQKLKDVTKDIMLRVRIDKDTDDKLSETANILQTSKSDIIRQGILNEHQKAKKKGN